MSKRMKQQIYTYYLKEKHFGGYISDLYQPEIIKNFVPYFI